MEFEFRIAQLQVVTEAEMSQLFSNATHQDIDAGLRDKALAALVELPGSDQRGSETSGELAPDLFYYRTSM